MNQLKAGAILSYISLGLSNIIGLIYTPFMLRMMGQSEFGLYSLVASVVAYLTVLDFGFGNAIIRYTAKFRAEGKTEEQYSMFGMFILLYSCIGVLAFLAGLGLYFNVDTLFGKTMSPEELNKAQVMMLLLIFNLAATFPLSIFGSIISAYENFIFQKIVIIIRIILNPLVMVVMLLMGYKAVGMVVITTIFNIATLLSNWWYCKYRLRIHIYYKNYDRSLLKEIGGFSFFLFIKLILDKIYWSSGQFVLGAVSGTVSVALYSLAIQIKGYYGSFTYILSPLFLPKLTKMITNQSSMNDISALFIKVGRIQFIIAQFILSGFLLFGYDFINLWAGSDYTMSYWIILILIVPLTFPLIQSLGHPLFQALNKQKIQTLIYLLAAILSISLSIPLTINYGVLGTALSISVAIIVCEIFIMNIYYSRIGINVVSFWRSILILFLKTMPLFLISAFLRYYYSATDAFVLMIQIILYSCMYFLIFYFILSDSYEKNLVYSITEKIKERIYFI